jgi:hypothetical protein
MQYTAQAVHEACLVYRKALGDAIVLHLCGGWCGWRRVNFTCCRDSAVPAR